MTDTAETSPIHIRQEDRKELMLRLVASLHDAKQAAFDVVDFDEGHTSSLLESYFLIKRQFDGFWTYSVTEFGLDVVMSRIRALSTYDQAQHPPTVD